MKDLLKLLKRFLPPYQKYVVLNILFNLLSALLGVFSFGALVPILNILFKVDGTEKVFDYVEMNYSSIESSKETIINNLNYAIQHMASLHGITYVLVGLAIFLILGTLLKTGTAYLAAFFHIPIRTGVVRDIRKQIDDKILSLPLGFFSNERKGDIIARMTGDVSEVENSVMSSLDMISKNPILILVYLGTMLFISWQLTLFVFIVLPIAGFIMGRIGKSLKRKSLEAQNKWGVLMSHIEETLSGLRIIKAFGAEKKIADRFDTCSNEFRDMSNRIARRQQLGHPVSEFLGTVTIAIVLCFGGTLILGENATMEASTFIYYLTIFYMIIQPAKDLSKSVYTIKKGMASMDRIDKILDAKNEIQDPENPKPVTFEDEVTYRNVWFKYQNDWVIKDVSITVAKGQTIALVGQSGSGKSTMVDLLPRFYDVDKGGIYLDGKNITDFKMYDLRMVMGNVNQEAILFNDTFFNNIAFGVANATMEDVVEAARIANAHDFISATANGYHTNIGDRGGKLSGGQRQRISIARAILKNPQILILDEATSALDTESEKLVQDALDNLMKNRTTIVVAHRLSTIKNADKIYVMHEGAVVEEGTHDELYNINGYYRKLCDMQQF